MNPSSESTSRPASPDAPSGRFAALLDASPVGMAFFDHDRRIHWANAAFATSAGSEPAAMHGRTLAEITPALAGLIDPLLVRSIERHEVADDEVIEVPGRGGRSRTWLVHAFPVRDSDPLGAGCTLVDITAQRQAERELREMREELELKVERRTAELAEANKELDAFAYSVSHDLRAPLRALKGFSGILREEYAEALPEEGRHYLTRLEQGAADLTSLVNELLAFSRLSRQPLEKHPVDTDRLARDVARELLAEEGQRAIELEWGELPSVEADPQLLRQVFVNLISNAFKFSRGRTPAHVVVGSRIDDARAPGRRVFFVKDDGVGFDMKYADRLFNVFQRLHPAETYEGVGAGLAIVQRIVKRHGGMVWADAAPDQGATFAFTLE